MKLLRQSFKYSKCCPRASWEQRDIDIVGTDGDFPDTCTISCFAQVLQSTLANSPGTCYMSFWHQWRLPSCPHVQQTSQWQHYTAWMVITFTWKKTLSSFVFRCPKYTLYTKFFGSTQYSCHLTVCLSWQKIQLKLFKILSKIIKNGIQVTTWEIRWNLVVPRKKEKEKRKNEVFPVYRTQKMIMKTFCA